MAIKIIPYQFRPADSIAALLILAFFLLEISGHDGNLAPSVAVIVGYYFGKRGQEINQTNAQN